MRLQKFLRLPRDRIDLRNGQGISLLIEILDCRRYERSTKPVYLG